MRQQGDALGAVRAAAERREADEERAVRLAADTLLDKALRRLTDGDRAKYYALAQQRVTEAHLWMPVMNVAM